MDPETQAYLFQNKNCALTVQVLNTVPVIAAVIKRVTIVKENITPKCEKKGQIFY